MVADDFLDTNIVVNYVNYNEGSKKIVKDSRDYIEKIKGGILLCGFVVRELENLLKKKARIHNAVLKKINKEDYDLSGELGVRELPHAKKLYALVKDIDLETLSEDFAEERVLFEVEIEKFLKFKVDKFVVPLENIDSGLVGQIHDLISNIDDCKVLASALQYQKNQNKLFNFVTADDDFDENGYEYIEDHFKINYSKEGYLFPKLINLLYVK